MQMSERIGAFDPEDFPDYKDLTAEKFDWPAWIEQETLRRQVLPRRPSAPI